MSNFGPAELLGAGPLEAALMKANAALIDGLHSRGSRNLDRSLMASLAGDGGTTADLFIIGATHLLQGS